MKKSTIISMACAAVAVCSPLASNAQTVAADSVMQHARGSRLSVGGYGEVAYSRNFYSDSGNRYSSAKLHKNVSTFRMQLSISATTLARAGR